AVDALRRAVFVGRADGHGVAVTADRNADAEPVVVTGVRCLEEYLLRPRGAVANEHVGGSRRGVGPLIHVASGRIDTGFQAVFVGRTGGNRVAVIADRDGVAEGVLR